jgi:prephenate dehydratase
MKKPVIGLIGGKGRMGQLFASFFKEREIKVLISDRQTKLSNKDLAKKADIVIVSVPIDKTEKVIKEVALHLREGSALTDITSVKEMPMKAMGEASCEVFGMHPMFGDSNPIPGQTIIFCPSKEKGAHYKWLKKFFSENGAEIEEMKAQEHDKMMALAQGFVHFADISFAEGFKEAKVDLQKFLKFTSKASELKIMLAARLINQDPGLYANIQIQNPNNLKVLKTYQKSISKLIKIIEKKDLKSFTKEFTKTRKFLGNYSKEAYAESNELIDKMIEKRNRKKHQRSKKSPEKNALALLGPKNTYSDLAADQIDETSSRYYAKDIEEIFELVAKGKVKSGFIPIENKLNGTIRETLDGLFAKNVHLNSKVNLEIHHNLITLPHAVKKDIKTIISHPQALSQCKKYLKKNFPKAEKHPYSSTAASIEKMIFSHNKEIGVIASKASAKAHNLKIFAKNIEDQKGNVTSFLLIKKGKFTPAANHTVTSIAFHFDQDSPGSLFQVFKDFADNKINLTKIESRPTKKDLGDYIFYLDFEGSVSDPNVKKILQKIEQKVAKMKVLGAY